MTGAAPPDRPPELLIVVDTEEEFDWTKPLDRNSTGTRSIMAQERAQSVYDRLGVVPTYVIDYPVATDPAAAEYFRDLQESGRAEVGAHLHAWVTPPHVEEVNAFNSYQCNLPLELKRSKLEVLTEAVARNIGRRPTIFKAGRHGFGQRTAALLADFGYRIDCSVLPYHDLGADGGPDFSRFSDQPYWLEGGVLEVPVTSGFIGAAPRLGELLPGFFDNRLSAGLRLPGLLGRTGLLTRSRLTPEGVSAAEQCRLLDILVRRGRRTFTLVYHSPSLEPGNTPYVRDQAQLARFLGAIEQVLTHFQEALGGRFTTMTALHARMSAERDGAASPVAAPAQRPPQFVPAPVAAAGRAARG
jgi:hypothetical protein